MVFLFVEAQGKDGIGSVIDIDMERAFWSTLFEPGMMRSVDLRKFAKAWSAFARWVNARTFPIAGFPEFCGDHGSPKGFVIDPEIVTLEQLFGSKSWTEVGIVSADQARSAIDQLVTKAAIASFTQPPGPQTGLTLDRNRRQSR